MSKTALAALAAMTLLAGCDLQKEGNRSAEANDVADDGASNAPAPAPVTAEQAQRIFRERHEGMERIGKSTKAINQQLKSDAPDLAAIRASAAAIDALAGRSTGWFPAGTGQDVLHKTRALPAIWQKPEDFAAKDRALREAAQAFDEAARSGDLSRIKAQFAALGKTCKACHDNYRAEEHPE